MNIIEYLYLRQKKNLVYYDSLTGAKTRLYYDRVAKARYQRMEVMVVFVDINHLKEINDTKGHHEGSRVIRKVGHELLKIPNTYDVCRIGGDEFIVFCNTEMDLSYFEVLHNVSYGCYTKESFEDVSSACKKADDAMYTMKTRKHNEHNSHGNGFLEVVKTRKPNALEY